MENIILQQLGLNPQEIEVYQALLNKVQLTAQQISQATSLNRTNVYNFIESLEKKGLIESVRIGKKNYFRIAHPAKLKELFEKQEKEFLLAKENLSANLSTYVSEYNLAVGKPGIRFYDGREVDFALDYLSSKTEILQYSSPQTEAEANPQVEAAYQELKKKYKKEPREALKIKTRILSPDTPQAREIYGRANKEVTTVKYLSPETQVFSVYMKIYDNKVAYLNMDKNKAIGFIIEDPQIYQFHKAIFEDRWRLAHD